ncbi:Hypothetical predicted protein [Cloeon dipterum]|uniref:Uncharacterized protein n=1 Tax=Cloeon dipterum TaxID=197152 RepID=A0A8S1CKH1_9INSE|nr:Hypothetical predicted protein [Cloeon dipterum]
MKTALVIVCIVAMAGAAAPRDKRGYAVAAAPAVYQAAPALYHAPAPAVYHAPAPAVYHAPVAYHPAPAVAVAAPAYHAPLAYHAPAMAYPVGYTGYSGYTLHRR